MPSHCRVNRNALELGWCPRSDSNRHASRRRILSCDDISQTQALKCEDGTQTYHEQTAKVGCADLATSDPKMETPGALAGATGAMSNELAFKTKHYRQRAKSATALCYAIADCDPADACEIMAAAHADLSIGMPIAPLLSVMDEASSLADMATFDELKAYALACYTRLRPADQLAFLAYVGRAA